MPFAVSISKLPLVYSTLPALKVRYWNNTQNHIYAMARLYFLNGNMHISLQAFERRPKNTSYIEFAFGTGVSIMQIRVSPNQAVFAVRDASFPPKIFDDSITWAHLPETTDFAQSDEMGHSWGKHILVPSHILRKSGISGQVKSKFYAAVLKYSSEDDSIGTSYKPMGEELTLNTALFDTMITVDY